MQAIVQERYGSAPEEVLRLAEVEKPEVVDGTVLVRVRAASVDRGTYHAMTGLPYPIRAAGFGVRRPKAMNPGRSVAGTVEAVGRNVSEVAIGDDVYGICDGGSFAEYATPSAAKISRMPANLSFEQAASVPISGVTALQAVRDHAQIQSGETVVVVGASGGVGTFAVQIAKALGAEVTGVCSTSKVDLVRSLGADHVVDYTQRDFTDGDVRYDAIVDTGGNTRLAHLRRALTSKGRLVIVGGETSGRLLAGSGRQIRATVVSRFVSQKLGTFIASENASDLAALRELIEAGKVTPAVGASYPLSETATAIRLVVDGAARGKVVIAV